MVSELFISPIKISEDRRKIAIMRENYDFSGNLKNTFSESEIISETFYVNAVNSKILDYGNYELRYFNTIL